MGGEHSLEGERSIVVATLRKLEAEHRLGEAERKLEGRFEWGDRQFLHRRLKHLDIQS